jgi:hypothetical protein
MRSKILTGAAAFTLATTAGLVTTAPASAQNWQGNRGNVRALSAALGSALALASPWGFDLVATVDETDGSLANA